MHNRQLQTIDKKEIQPFQPISIQLRFSLALFLFAFYMTVIRPWLLRRSASDQEAIQHLQGDELLPRRNLQTTHAINIPAAPDSVWRFLAQQLSREPATLPERTDVTISATSLEPGQLLTDELKVLQVTPQSELIAGAFETPAIMGGHIDVIYSYHLQALPSGHTRLIVRMRGYSDGNPLVWFHSRAFEVFQSLQIVEQLERIKAQAEINA